MTELAPSLLAGIAAGLLGSTHCLGMCGGLSGLFALEAASKQAMRQLPLALAYNAGRLSSYALLGLLVAALGSRVVDVLPDLARPVRLIAGIIIVLIGMQIAFDLRLLSGVERMGGVLWQQISPLARYLMPASSAPRAFGLGLLWGFIPCGLVYSMLLVAASAPAPAGGALIMLAFGAGTTPMMLATGLGAVRIAHLMNRRSTRLGAGLLVAALGVLTMLLPVTSLFSGGGHHH